MAASRLPSARSWFASLGAILLLSTGAAGSTILESEGVAGHTSYVQAVVALPAGPIGPEAPLHYGLATLREDFLFGLWSQERPLDEPSQWLVYTWAEHTPDPRDNPSLRPTGDQALITDRTGTKWTVYELTYRSPEEAPARPEFGLDEPPEFYTYVVAPSETRTLEDGTRYNHVITYRPDRLVADLQQLDPPRFEDTGIKQPSDPADTFHAQGKQMANPVESHPVVVAPGPVPASLERFV